jgi:hypothetical protein
MPNDSQPFRDDSFVIVSVIIYSCVGSFKERGSSFHIILTETAVSSVDLGYDLIR